MKLRVFLIDALNLCYLISFKNSWIIRELIVPFLKIVYTRSNICSSLSIFSIFDLLFYYRFHKFLSSRLNVLRFIIATNYQQQLIAACLITININFL